ncbi:hypothetical protein ONS95_006754 [Cadophora gregata]|uniref:uncharacterized protein n=1 Tax=Cadophora gregata TaxID=51156 RepID=UPI0026DCA127|nr:uncharacterized protein ONS95_006754 [Cadophora gregata]KAK0101591.1 hypothetical protein ONS95_006754 [Cadophora gregata]KAK0106396.1 hypothetical protein ONS96_004028 [Cadophora gregata f. sp. sojae]
MPQVLRFVSFLLLSLHSISASPVGVVPPTYSKIPYNSVLFTPPSQKPIPNHHQPLPDDTLASHGKINPSPDHLSLVKYTLLSKICYPLISEATYLMSDLSQQLLVEYLDGVAFPTSAGTPLPVYIAANITEQLYRRQYVLSLALKLTPVEDGSDKVAPSDWRSIIDLVEQSVAELYRTARMMNAAGLGSLLVLEAEVAGYGIHAEWRFWSIVDGVAVMCEG